MPIIKFLFTLFITLNLLFFFAMLNNTYSLDDFAAQLLCEAGEIDCNDMEYNDSKKHPIVVDGVTLPDDAARDRKDEQTALVKQGAYLRIDGKILSLETKPVTVIIPERGKLMVDDHGSAAIVPEYGPVIITVPGSRREGEADD